jgi:hypothetical protein
MNGRRPVFTSPGTPDGTSVWRHLTACLFLLAVIPAASPTADGDRKDADSLPALRESPPRQYRAYRRMHAENEKFGQEGWLEAWTELDEGGFRYQVVRERGSDYVRDKVLRAVLKREQELIAAGSADRAELTAANYDFEEVDEASDAGERYVLLKPKRKDMLLVDGRMVLNQSGTELLRVEGRLAKNPSFWMNLVNVTREFARVDGVRVPVTLESVAKLKFAGLSRMDVQYEYEAINGRPVSLSARRMLADGQVR